MKNLFALCLALFMCSCASDTPKLSNRSTLQLKLRRAQLQEELNRYPVDNEKQKVKEKEAVERELVSRYEAGDQTANIFTGSQFIGLQGSGVDWNRMSTITNISPHEQSMRVIRFFQAYPEYLSKPTTREAAKAMLDNAYRYLELEKTNRVDVNIKSQ